MSTAETKVWGSVQHVFDGPIAVSLLSLDHAGVCCSIHKHNKRDNLFHVLSGTIFVHVFFVDKELKIRHDYTHCLGSSDIWTAEFGIVHCFEVLEPGKVVEVYKTIDGSPADIEDIQRYKVGGLAEEVLAGTNCPKRNW